MQLLETKNINATISLELYSEPNDEYCVAIFFDGVYWDEKRFYSMAEAEAFMLDPLAKDRRRDETQRARDAEREAAAMPYYAAMLTKVSKGRRVGPKPPAS